MKPGLNETSSSRASLEKKVGKRRDDSHGFMGSLLLHRFQVTRGGKSPGTKKRVWRRVQRHRWRASRAAAGRSCPLRAPHPPTAATLPAPLSQLSQETEPILSTVAAGNTQVPQQHVPSCPTSSWLHRPTATRRRNSSRQKTTVDLHSLTPDWPAFSMSSSSLAVNKEMHPFFFFNGPRHNFKVGWFYNNVWQNIQK